MSQAQRLSERVLAGDIRAASRLMRNIDDGDPSATAELQALFPHTGRAWVVGITGSPGAGKSTLTNRLIAGYRKQGKRVGVLAVDPTSPFTGGAILGDRIRMQDHATDPGVFMEPEDAAQAWCDKYGHQELLSQMIKVFHAYLAKFPEPPGDVIAVEAPVTAVLGELRGEWGLWVGEERDGEWRSLDGAYIEVTPLHMPDHREHGRPITLTRRIDLVTRDKSGRYYIWDHKHQASVNAKSSATAYAIDGGFAAFRIMGKQLYGEAFGGLTLNLISSTQPGVVAREQVPSTPHRDAHFAKWLWWAEHQIAQLDMTVSPWEWPKAQNELSCYGRYGPCAGLSLCSLGPRG